MSPGAAPNDAALPVLTMRTPPFPLDPLLIPPLPPLVLPSPASFRISLFICPSSHLHSAYLLLSLLNLFPLFLFSWSRSFPFHLLCLPLHLFRFPTPFLFSLFHLLLSAAATLPSPLISALTLPSSLFPLLLPPPLFPQSVDLFTVTIVYVVI